jgi:hypothetical protein
MIYIKMRFCSPITATTPFMVTNGVKLASTPIISLLPGFPNRLPLTAADVCAASASHPITDISLRVTKRAMN